MNGLYPATLPEPDGRLLQNCETELRETFRTEFKRSISGCVRWGFSIEESFGMIWEETLEMVPLSENGQARLYGELIDWAKRMDMTR